MKNYPNHSSNIHPSGTHKIRKTDLYKGILNDLLFNVTKLKNP